MMRGIYSPHGDRWQPPRWCNVGQFLEERLNTVSELGFYPPRKLLIFLFWFLFSSLSFLLKEEDRFSSTFYIWVCFLQAVSSNSAPDYFIHQKLDLLIKLLNPVIFPSESTTISETFNFLIKKKPNQRERELKDYRRDKSNTTFKIEIHSWYKNKTEIQCQLALSVCLADLRNQSTVGIEAAKFTVGNPQNTQALTAVSSLGGSWVSWITGGSYSEENRVEARVLSLAPQGGIPKSEVVWSVTQGL